MILCAHADAGFLNETNSRSWAGPHIHLSEDDPFPCFNGAILFIAQIITESELAPIFVNAREMIPHHQNSLIWVGPNLKALSRLTTPQLLGLPTIQLFHVKAR
jgi:hypothetical protein